MNNLTTNGDIVLNPVNTTSRINDALTADFLQQIPRGHLGMSGIGNPDLRTQWLKFRWCLPDVPAPRTLRIFELGNILEDEVIRLLKLTGFDVWEIDPTTGKQFNFKRLGGHFAGSADGIIKGIPESNQAHVLEVKSAKESKGNELKKHIAESASENDALKKWNPDYFGQTQCYMHELGLMRTLFFVYVKNTSEIITLRIKPEKFYFEGALSNAERIITTDEPPASSYKNRDWYEIKKFKSEEYQAVYWGDTLPPKAHCRNCRHACPIVDERTNATWFCNITQAPRSIEGQHKGCNQHNFLPSLMPAEFVKIHDDCNVVEYKTSDGKTFFNSCMDNHEWNVFSSFELIEFSKLGLKDEVLFDEINAELRAEFKSRLVEIIPGPNLPESLKNQTI